MLFNTLDPLFSDPKVRLGISYGINKEYIVKHILNGYGVIAAGPMGVDSQYHNPDVLSIPYDPMKGRELLKQSGWSYNPKIHRLIKNNKSFEFTLLIFDQYQIEKQVARYIKLCMNEMGIKVHLKAVPYKDLILKYRRNKEFQAVLTEFKGAYRNPEYLLEQWTSNFSGNARAGCFEDPEISNLLNNAFQAQNEKTKRKLLFQVDAMINKLQPGAFLYHKTTIDVMSKRFMLSNPFSLTHVGIYNIRNAIKRKF